jgi:hypothetical protein
MTRKDYVMIAETLRQTLADIARDASSDLLTDTGRTHLGGERAGVRHAALRVMEALAAENPRFERETFLKACGFYD